MSLTKYENNTSMDCWEKYKRKEGMGKNETEYVYCSITIQYTHVA